MAKKRWHGFIIINPPHYGCTIPFTMKPSDLAVIYKPQAIRQSVLSQQTLGIYSDVLERKVTIDCFMPLNMAHDASISLLLINDGQNMKELGLAGMLEDLMVRKAITPLLCVAVHAGNRMAEYGTACRSDYMARGAKAGMYTRFILHELIPYIQSAFGIRRFSEKSFAGFSLGGLSAIDIVWNHPHEFTKAGVFSGSLWWRTKDVMDGYVEDTDRIMHAQIREGRYAQGQKFFFETGTLDETADRNNNGIIDSIDDTLGLIRELLNKGYRDDDIAYVELPDGKHDIATWARAMPAFLQWGWGRR